MATDPTFPRVYRRLGDLYYERKDFVHAYDNYEKVIRLTPDDIRATLQAGNCARRLGRLAEADRLFQKAEKVRPDSWIPTYNRACLLAINHHPEQALAMLTSLVQRRRIPPALVERDFDLASMRALPGYAELRKRLLPADEDDLE
ncbi:MAG: tetratricopeptide repeat protein [Terriglobia bacterium]